MRSERQLGACLILALATIILAPGAALAQSYTVSGKVENPNNNNQGWPAGDVKIQVAYASSGMVIASALNGVGGAFSVSYDASCGGNVVVYFTVVAPAPQGAQESSAAFAPQNWTLSTTVKLTKSSFSCPAPP